MMEYQTMRTIVPMTLEHLTIMDVQPLERKILMVTVSQTHTITVPTRLALHQITAVHCLKIVCVRMILR